MKTLTSGGLVGMHSLSAGSAAGGLKMSAASMSTGFAAALTLRGGASSLNRTSLFSSSVSYHQNQGNTA